MCAVQTKIGCCTCAGSDGTPAKKKKDLVSAFRQTIVSFSRSLSSRKLRGKRTDRKIKKNNGSFVFG